MNPSREKQNTLFVVMDRCSVCGHVTLMSKQLSDVDLGLMVSQVDTSMMAAAAVGGRLLFIR